MFEGCTIKKQKDPHTGNVGVINVTYPTNSDGMVKVLSVPINSANADYQAILEWEKIDGNTIEEAD
jgi:hypothetical protein|tara:strand:+ start:328 stop:525 length:198 start_codon:yes stop_codon:yes gene_type:complete